MFLEEQQLSDKKILLVIDKFDELKTDARISKHLKANIEVIQRHHAEDSSPAVAAASVLARYIRDSEMDDLTEELGIPVTKENLKALLDHSEAEKAVRYEYVKSTLARGASSPRMK